MGVNKVVGVTLPIYLLCRELERLEDSDEIIFSVFYPFSATLESHHYCSGWEFELEYYEIRYDDFDILQVIKFPFRGHMGDTGQVLTEEQITELVERLKEI